jgi:cytochrome oxidase Cu insertion factor (SCO1/SenC/PrrC family)
MADHLLLTRIRIINNIAVSLTLMKKKILLISLLALVIAGYGQADSLQAPYLRFPSYPPVKLLLPDSTFFSKADLSGKQPVMLMIYDPNCDHCQQATEELIKNIDKFKGIQIVMVTMVSMAEIKKFIAKYRLSQYDNIIAGQDTNFFLVSFYMGHHLPYFAFYNRKLELISVLEGSIPIEKLLKELDK